MAPFKVTVAEAGNVGWLLQNAAHIFNGNKEHEIFAQLAAAPSCNQQCLLVQTRD
jgi:hypothetical protein